MKSMILHIGIPKTGSSALQVFWAQNREALLAQSIDYFPIGEFALGKRGKISAGNGALIARSFLRPDSAGYKANRDEQLAALDRHISASSCDTGLLSSELFVFAENEVLSNFSDWLAMRGISLRIFYFIREQVQFLTSSYIQQVKRHACTETSEEYVLRVFEKMHHIKYSKLFERMAKIVEPAQIICRNYHDARGLEGVYDLFLASFGLDSQGLKFVEKEVNVGLDMTEIKIMLLLNKLKPRMVFSDYIVENAVLRGRKTSDATHQLLSSETIEKLQSYFADDNTRFARSYFGRAILFDNLHSNIDTPRIADVDPSSAEIVEIFGGLLVRFDERLGELEKKMKRLVDSKQN